MCMLFGRIQNTLLFPSSPKSADQSYERMKLGIRGDSYGYLQNHWCHYWFVVCMHKGIHELGISESGNTYVVSVYVLCVCVMAYIWEPVH